MVNQHYTAEQMNRALGMKNYYSQPSDVEQIYFYMNREDALTVHSGVFGVYTDFMLTASRKQAELSSQIGELTIFNFPLPVVGPKRILTFLCTCQCGTI